MKKRHAEIREHAQGLKKMAVRIRKHKNYRRTRRLKFLNFLLNDIKVHDLYDLIVQISKRQSHVSSIDVDSSNGTKNKVHLFSFLFGLKNIFSL